MRHLRILASLVALSSSVRAEPHMTVEPSHEHLDVAFDHVEHPLGLKLWLSVDGGPPIAATSMAIANDPIAITLVVCTSPDWLDRAKRDAIERAIEAMAATAPAPSTIRIIGYGGHVHGLSKRAALRDTARNARKVLDVGDTGHARLAAVQVGIDELSDIYARRKVLIAIGPELTTDAFGLDPHRIRQRAVAADITLSTFVFEDSRSELVPHPIVGPMSQLADSISSLMISVPDNVRATFDLPGLPSDGREHRLTVYDYISVLAESRIVLGTPAEPEPEAPAVVTTRGPIVESWVSALVGSVGIAGIFASCGVAVFITRQRRRERLASESPRRNAMRHLSTLAILLSLSSTVRADPHIRVDASHQRVDVVIDNLSHIEERKITLAVEGGPEISATAVVAIEAPIAIALVICQSTDWLDRTKLEAIERAIEAMAAAAPSGSTMSIIGYGGHVHSISSRSPIRDYARKALRTALDEGDRGNELFAGIQLGIEELVGSRAARKVVIAIGPGRTTQAFGLDANLLAQRASDADVDLHVLLTEDAVGNLRALLPYPFVVSLSDLAAKAADIMAAVPASCRATFGPMALPWDGRTHQFTMSDHGHALATTRIALPEDLPLPPSSSPQDGPTVVREDGPVIASWVTALVGGLGIAGIVASCAALVVRRRRRAIS